MTEKVRPGTIRPFTREDVLNALARAGAKAVARAQALGLEPVIRSRKRPTATVRPTCAANSIPPDT